MKKLEEDFETLIVSWLQSDDDNATNLAHSLSELAKKQALILPVVIKSVCDLHPDAAYCKYRFEKTCMFSNACYFKQTVL